MTVYTAASGSTVVATGSMYWPRALDDQITSQKLEPDVTNPAVQQSFRNILAKFGAASP